MLSIIVDLSANYELLETLVNTKRAADSRGVIPSYAKVNRITGNGPGMTIVSRSPFDGTESYRLANNESTPYIDDTKMGRRSLNSFWLKGEVGDETAKIEIEY